MLAQSAIIRVSYSKSSRRKKFSRSNTEGVASFFPPAPVTVKQTQASPEWPHWRGATDVEMMGLVKNGVLRPDSKFR